MNESQYEEFRVFLEKACGIVLGANKQYLVSSRLNRLMADHKLADMGALVRALKTARSSDLKNQIVEAMTTNETSWFRDAHPFACMQEKILPELAKTGRNPLRIWSAACSSGQEPYSLSMTVQEFQQKNPGVLRATVQVVATDISPGMLRSAEKGRYDDMAMARGLSLERKQKYFQETPAYFEVTRPIRARVQFRELNLLQSYALLGRFDIIFCRNVLIYFSSESKRDILQRMARTLQPGGYLFLGGSESITGLSNAFQMQRYHGGVVYQLK